ncbi:Aristolochene synthase in complex with 12,13 Difluorofarnesyl diphosphate [Xylaria flabelliformis]|nr:Aristolochene synthase in complex with 12,13 Difluorofarnesyl diphosphate [Xylaria flabelliformis]KAI0858983.1 Aristolochene synthase in complex with 12,13 Difluorofarnesyl diphosphate [Xylaria cubensis]
MKAPNGLQEYPTSCLLPAEAHPLVHDISKQVDQYFLDHWQFPDEKARKKFVNAGFSQVTCYYFPKARNDRIGFACRLLTVLFLVDDLLEQMSLEDGERYNQRLIDLSRGDTQPDRSVPVEYIIYDLWEDMRTCDAPKAAILMDGTFVFMRAQTDKARLRPMTLHEYLEYREKDVGKALLGSLMIFSMNLEMSEQETAAAVPADRACSKHLSVINDAWSYEKEVHASKTLHKEGAILCTCVAILAHDSELSVPATKRVLYSMVREWELQFKDLVANILTKLDTPVLRAYLQGLEFQMTGNEHWSRTTLRYLRPTD